MSNNVRTRDGGVFNFVDGLKVKNVDFEEYISGQSSTNLTINSTATTVSINSSTGTDVTITAATPTEAGVMTAADKVKLSSIDLTTIQDTLVSGTNIKTINGTAILGAGNIVIDGGGASDATSVAFTPVGNISSNTVQAAVAELDNEKQPTLVSGTTIKTINTNSLLGSGNLSVQDTLVSGTNIKTINNTSILGSGNISISGGAATATDVTFTPSGGLSSTNMQTALVELDNEKQPTLVSGTNIKTINTNSLLGSGNINVQDTLISGTNIKTINGTSILGSGNITIAAGAGSGIYFDVKSYGAKGDGVTDDTAAIKTAVAAANAVGGVLYFPPGTYIISSTIIVDNSADTDPFAPKMSIQGNGPSASKIWATAGEWDAFAFWGGVNGAGMHSHQKISDVTIHKDTGGAAITLSNVAFAMFSNAVFRGAKYGIYATDILSSSFYNCQFLWNSIAGVRMERSAIADGFQSGSNALNFHGCVFGSNGHFGAWFGDGGSINITGGSVEGNGVDGNSGFPRAGIYAVNLGLESGVGLNISGTYFENNKGTADVWLANNSHSTANAITGSTFNRISSTNFTTYNIHAEGSSVTTSVSISGCGFKHFNNYVPDVSRPAFKMPYSHPARFSWTGCYFSSTIDTPNIRNWTSDRLAYGVITSSGTLAGDSSYSNIASVTKLSTGRYRIAFAEPSQSVNPVINATMFLSGTPFVFASDSTYCTVQTENTTGAAIDSPFCFTAFG